MAYRVYDKIDALLREREWSRRKLAIEAGINVSTMSALFARRPNPLPDKYLRRMAAALGVDKSVFSKKALDEEYEQKTAELFNRIAHGELPDGDEEEQALLGRAALRVWKKEQLHQAEHLTAAAQAIMEQIDNLSDAEIESLETAIFYLRMQRTYARNVRCHDAN